MNDYRPPLQDAPIPWTWVRNRHVWGSNRVLMRLFEFFYSNNSGWNSWSLGSSSFDHADEIRLFRFNVLSCFFLSHNKKSERNLRKNQQWKPNEPKAEIIHKMMSHDIDISFLFFWLGSPSRIHVFLQTSSSHISFFTSMCIHFLVIFVFFFVVLKKKFPPMLFFHRFWRAHITPITAWWFFSRMAREITKVIVFVKSFLFFYKIFLVDRLTLLQWKKIKKIWMVVLYLYLPLLLLSWERGRFFRAKFHSTSKLHDISSCVQIVELPKYKNQARLKSGCPTSNPSNPSNSSEYSRNASIVLLTFNFVASVSCRIHSSLL